VRYRGVIFFKVASISISKGRQGTPKGKRGEATPQRKKDTHNSSNRKSQDVLEEGLVCLALTIP